MSVRRVTALGRVVGVQRRKNKVSGERRANRDIRRLAIADFADHDHVRILPHDVPNPAANVSPIAD